MSASLAPILEVKELSARYGSVEALHAVTMAVEDGEFVAILGPNGAGKSTLMRAVMGLVANSGSVRFRGQALPRTAPDACAARGVVLVPEGRGIFAPMTVEENLALGGFSRRREGASVLAAARDDVYALGIIAFQIIVGDLKSAPGTDAADMLSASITALGHDVRRIYEGPQATDAAASFRPQLVFLDLGMPKVGGHEVARQIRAQDWGSGILLVALTGWGQDEDRRRSKEAGFDHHLVKPAELDEIARLCAQAASVPG